MTDDDFNSEQKAMLKNRDEWHKRIQDRKKELGLIRTGTKFLGDVGVRVVAHYLERRMPNLKVVLGPAFIADFEEREFDLLIADKDAAEAEFTNAYPKSKVCAIVEVKGFGFICKKCDVKTKIKKDIVDYSDRLKLPVLYFSFIESNSYGEEIRKVLGSNAFILAKSTGRGYEVVEDEWKRFVDFILELSKSRR